MFIPVLVRPLNLFVWIAWETSSSSESGRSTETLQREFKCDGLQCPRVDNRKDCTQLPACHYTSVLQQFRCQSYCFYAETFTTFTNIVTACHSTHFSGRCFHTKANLRKLLSDFPALKSFEIRRQFPTQKKSINVFFFSFFGVHQISLFSRLWSPITHKVQGYWI